MTVSVSDTMGANVSAGINAGVNSGMIFCIGAGLEKSAVRSFSAILVTAVNICTLQI